MTRPVVLQVIASLKDEPGTPLFERLADRVKLTAPGKALLPQLRAVPKDLDRALVVTKRVGEGKTGALNISYGWLPLLSSRFLTHLRPRLEKR